MATYDPQMAEGELLPGQPVFDANHEKVGVITALPPNAGYAIVQQGWLITHDWYIPFSAIDRIEGTDVHLNVPRAHFQQMGWDAAPTTILPPVTAVDTELTRPISAPRPPAPDRAAALTIPLHREELVATTRPVERGKAHIHTTVVEEVASVTAPVMREQVRITRVARPKQRATLGPHTFVAQDFTISVMGEELSATKRAVVTDQVRIRKDVVAEDQAISDILRRERVEISGVDADLSDQFPSA